MLLGDVVDLRTYPFRVVPPTFADIARANPAIFAPDGALCRALDALEGRVTWVVGNHDMGVTPTDTAVVVSAAGRTLRMAPELVHHPYAPDRRLLMSHGHQHTLFNAIDDASVWATLPAGHFVTRAVAEHWNRNLGPGQTVADLAGQGAPNGLDLAGMASAISGLDHGGVMGMLLDFVEGALDVDGWDPILMPDGSVATLAHARRVFLSAWDRWADKHGGGRQGHIEAARSAHADALEQPGWHAQSDGFEHGADLVVMGHTHGAIDGLDNSLIGYLNTGFECPAVVDMASRAVTFAVVDASGSDLTGEIWEVVDVNGVISCRPTTARAEDTSRYGTMDFSSYIEIDNRAGASELRLTEASVSRGRFVHPPPGMITAGERRRIWVQDDLGPYGSAAELTYERANGQRIVLAVECPTGFFPNRCRSTAPFIARSGRADWGAVGEVRALRHPLFVRIDTT